MLTGGLILQGFEIFGLQHSTVYHQVCRAVRFFSNLIKIHKNVRDIVRIGFYTWLMTNSFSITSGILLGSNMSIFLKKTQVCPIMFKIRSGAFSSSSNETKTQKGSWQKWKSMKGGL